MDTPWGPLFVAGPRSFSGGFLVAKWRLWLQVEGLYPLHKSLSPPLV